MAHRTVEIVWLPGSQKSWATFSAARIEAARLWNDLVVRHHRLRRLQWAWPPKRRWEIWAKNRYPNLHSQTIQQVIEEFLEAVRSISSLRKKGHPEARYPWRKERYRDIPYTNQGARIRNGYLMLPNGKAGSLAVKIPKGLVLPGRLMEARLEYGRVLVVCKSEEEKPCGGDTVVGVDLGVNTLACATDGQTALVVSGRAVKATVQYRNKKLASLVQAQAGKERGSRRQKRLQRRKYDLLDKTSRKIRDACHKATRKIVSAFPGARFVVGALNIRQIGREDTLCPTPGLQAPEVRFVHPSKYPGRSQVVPAEPRQVAQRP